jgi:hypothetical protein
MRAAETVNTRQARRRNPLETFGLQRFVALWGGANPQVHEAVTR